MLLQTSYKKFAAATSYPTGNRDKAPEFKAPTLVPEIIS